jgi:hypothetical protein
MTVAGFFFQCGKNLLRGKTFDNAIIAIPALGGWAKLPWVDRRTALVPGQSYLHNIC